jgi:hypothetical protein
VQNEEEVQDPLKSLDKVLEPDIRQKNLVGSLEDRHTELSLIQLNESVHLEVKQLFETAKNLSLYSWFVYRFHQVSELVAFSALEMALRELYLKQNPKDPTSKKRDPTLFPLLQHAKKEGWITNDGFPSLYKRAKHLAEQEKAMAKMKEHDFVKEPSMSIDEPSEDEITEALSKLDIVSEITDNAHKIRNNLAHGSSTVSPSSVYTLSIISEVINQLYS